MSVYKGAKYLRESVESILSQEGVDFKFIIVNDCATDDSENTFVEYAVLDDRIRIIEQDRMSPHSSVDDSQGLMNCSAASRGVSIEWLSLI